MALQEHSFRHLLPTFIIPSGTQVVLTVDKPLSDGTVRQRGSVAVVEQSPPDNRYAYTLRFADGQSVEAQFRELTVRRKEVEDQLVLTNEDLRPWIIYRCRIGSRAFGLATEDSDDDLRGIYLPPARLHELEALLDRVYRESHLPEEPDRRAIHDFLVEHRLGGTRRE